MALQLVPQPKLSLSKVTVPEPEALSMTQMPFFVLKSRWVRVHGAELTVTVKGPEPLPDREAHAGRVAVEASVRVPVNPTG